MLQRTHSMTLMFETENVELVKDNFYLKKMYYWKVVEVSRISSPKGQTQLDRATNSTTTTK